MLDIALAHGYQNLRHPYTVPIKDFLHANYFVDVQILEVMPMHL
jgi:hypothetical protein